MSGRLNSGAEPMQRDRLSFQGRGTANDERKNGKAKQRIEKKRSSAGSWEVWTTSRPGYGREAERGRAWRWRQA